MLRAQINTFIDGFVDDGRADLLAEFFGSYPADVFLTIYGHPTRGPCEVLQWKEDMTRGGIIDPQAEVAAVAAYNAYIDSYLDHAGGGDDLLSQLIATDMTRDEFSAPATCFC